MSATAFAQNTRELVITATRIPTPATEIASDIAVITSDEIERRQIRTVDEALQTQPGLSVVRSGGPGKTAAVFSHGTNANQTLVLIDGIQVNDPSTTDGRTDFGGIDIADVDRIEVLYGSQGTLYGSDAIGAVINVITRSGKGPLSGRAMFEGGSFGTFRQAAGVSGADRRVRLRVQHPACARRRPVRDRSALRPARRHQRCRSQRDDDLLDPAGLSGERRAALRRRRAARALAE